MRYDIRICLTKAINVLTPRSTRTQKLMHVPEKDVLIPSIYHTPTFSLSLRHQKYKMHAAVIQTSHTAASFSPFSLPFPLLPIPSIPPPPFPLPLSTHIYLIPVSGPVIPLLLQQIATDSPNPTSKLKPTKPTIVPTIASCARGEVSRLWCGGCE